MPVHLLKKDPIIFFFFLQFLRFCPKAAFLQGTSGLLSAFMVADENAVKAK